MAFQTIRNDSTKGHNVFLSEKLFSKLKQYIEDHYRQKEDPTILEVCESCMPMPEMQRSMAPKKDRTLEDLVGQVEETFAQRLLGLIDEKGLTDVEAYKGANVDRRLFSKIRSQKDYNPSKITAISFAISLSLNLDETKDLLARAGYVLSSSSVFDLIIRFFIEEENYKIIEINEALFEFDQKLLGV